MNEFLVLIFEGENNHLYFPFSKFETRTRSVLTSQKYKRESGKNYFLREIRERVRSGGKIMKLNVYYYDCHYDYIKIYKCTVFVKCNFIICFIKLAISICKVYF